MWDFFRLVCVDDWRRQRCDSDGYFSDVLALLIFLNSQDPASYFPIPTGAKSTFHFMKFDDVDDSHSLRLSHLPPLLSCSSFVSARVNLIFPFKIIIVHKSSRVDQGAVKFFIMRRALRRKWTKVEKTVLWKFLFSVFFSSCWLRTIRRVGKASSYDDDIF